MLLGWELAATAVSACICLYHCHICTSMYTVCICLCMHVYLCILNNLEKKSLSMKCLIACMLHVCCMYFMYSDSDSLAVNGIRPARP
jgi:hypothetical protein